jgi:hypothetical protein
MDIAVPKGGVHGVAGCIEHTGVLIQIIRKAKEMEENLLLYDWI